MGQMMSVIPILFLLTWNQPVLALLALLLATELGHALYAECLFLHKPDNDDDDDQREPANVEVRTPDRKARPASGNDDDDDDANFSSSSGFSKREDSFGECSCRYGRVGMIFGLNLSIYVRRKLTCDV